MPKPFDLKKAKAGHLLVWESRGSATFVCEVPDAALPHERIVVLDSNKRLFTCDIAGKKPGQQTIFLTDPPKVIKYLCVWRRCGPWHCAMYDKPQEPMSGIWGDHETPVWNQVVELSGD